MLASFPEDRTQGIMMKEGLFTFSSVKYKGKEATMTRLPWGFLDSLCSDPSSRPYSHLH